MRILLTGFMGAGKTTVGRLLAERLGFGFLDLDEEIERASGLSIREFFARRGEAEFRALESRLLESALAREDVVVATGGGTLADPGSLERARRGGFVVWLHPAFATLVARVGALGKVDRPLFADERQALELYRRRLPFYRRADLTIEVAPEELPSEVAARIALALPRRACGT